MALKSRLFSGNQQLEDCAVRDAAHVTRGARGQHVALIQQALNTLDGANLATDGIYGEGTAAVVLRYKQKRGIINRAYQSQADDIVGKMTIASLDEEIARTELDVTCVYRGPPGFGDPVARAGQPVLAFAITGPTTVSEDEERTLQAALPAASCRFRQ